MHTFARLALVTLLLFIGLRYEALAQLTGMVSDASDGSPLGAVTVRVLSVADTSVVKGAITTRAGTFSIANVAPGRHRLVITYVGMRKIDTTFTMVGDSMSIGSIVMKQEITEGDAVLVDAMAVRVEQKGDTTQYNASAYKVNKNATTEDLVSKMPGVTIENGTVKSQGEEIKKVLVDGREFFGDDAAATLRNLPAEMVDKVQVFDRNSDQSMYSGFDDGNAQRTMNITTRSDKRQGSFGKMSGGYGSIDRYTLNGTYNYFDGAQRITLLGISNNINQQNFNFQDLVGSSGGGRQGGGGMPRGGGGMGGMGGGRGGPGGGSFGGGDASNFFVGQQNGITQTHAFGLNYSDQYGGLTNLTASYFVNWSGNDRSSALTRDYITAAQTQYDQSNLATNNSLNHRVNLRLETYFDTTGADVLSWTPRASYQDNQVQNHLLGVFTNDIGQQLSQTTTHNDGDNGALVLNQTLTYRHRFTNPGRTFSISASTDYSNRDNDNHLLSTNEFTDNIDSLSILDQQSVQTSKGLTTSGSVSWTEPVGERDVLQLTYNPSWTRNSSDKSTNALDSATNTYSILNPQLSNNYINEYFTQKFGGLYRLRFDDVIIIAGANYQIAQLSGNQSFPFSSVIDRNFANILPSVNMQVRFDKTSNLRLNYRTSTNPPSLTQLQSVVDNSNPIQLSTGNPNLAQDYSHNLFARYNTVDPLAGTSFFAFVSGTVTRDYVGQAVTLASRDTVLPDGTLLSAGSQLTTYNNMNGYFNTRAFTTYGFPVAALGSNLNLNAGGSYTRTPSMINNATNIASSVGMNAGFYLGTSMSENFDASASYNGTYTIVNNTLRSQLNANYFNHNLTARLVWRIGALACSTDVTNTMYSGLGAGYDQVYTVWGAGVGYRFLANDAAEIRLSIYDILGQNTNVARNVTETYIEDQSTKALTRYAMLTFTYDFRAFGGQMPGIGGGGEGPRRMP